MFCKNCGAEVSEKAYICTKCGYKLKKGRSIDSKGGGVWNTDTLFAVLFPLIGIILYFVFQETNPEKASKCAKGAAIGIMIGITLSILSYIFVYDYIMGLFRRFF